MRQTTDLGNLFSNSSNTPHKKPKYLFMQSEVSRPSPTKQTMLILARTREKKIYTYYKTFNIHTYNIQMNNLLLLMIHTYIHTHILTKFSIFYIMATIFSKNRKLNTEFL